MLRAPVGVQQESKLKVSIEKYSRRFDGTRSLRLVYDHGYATNTLGGRQNTTIFR